MLYDYPHIDTYVKQRTEELMYPYNPNQDENIGGGRSNMPGTPTERLALNIATDKRLSALERNKNCIDEALDESNSITVAIIKMVYFKKEKTVDGAAMSVSLSTSQVKRLRLNFFELVADKFGIWV